MLILFVGLLLSLFISIFLNNSYGVFAQDISGDSENSNDYALGEIIVKYRDDVEGNGNEIISDGRRVVYEYVERPETIKKIVRNSELYKLKFEDDKVEKIIEEYKGLDEVEYAEPNYLMRSFVIPNDASYSLKYGLVNINAEKAWNLTIGDGKVSIAVIDTGVDWDHPDLALNIWNNSGDNCDIVSDLDGNGYNGDCRGYDFTDINTTSYINLGYVLDNSEDYDIIDNNPMDFDGHGTHVAGIAGAVSNNSVGTTGVCWNCSIMPIRAGFRILHPSSGWIGIILILH